MSTDQNLIYRYGYYLLDLLADVGGIQGILIFLISFILSILNHSQLDSYLVSRLFKSETVRLTPFAKCENIKQFCIDKLLPQRLVCCRTDRKQVALRKAREELEKEMNVIKLIRSRRFFHMALKHLLDPLIHKKLKEKSQYKEIEIEPSGQTLQLGKVGLIVDQTNDVTTKTIQATNSFSVETMLDLS